MNENYILYEMNWVYFDAENVGLEGTTEGETPVVHSPDDGTPTPEPHIEEAEPSPTPESPYPGQITDPVVTQGTIEVVPGSESEQNNADQPKGFSMFSIIGILLVFVAGIIAGIAIKNLIEKSFARPKRRPYEIDYEPPTSWIPLEQKSESPIEKQYPASRSMSSFNTKVSTVHQQGAREEQQDSFGISDASLIDEFGMLGIVADGMGGLTGGDQVSYKVVDTLLERFMAEGNKNKPPKELLVSLVKAAVKSVNEMLGPQRYRKSGSTLSMVYIKDSKLFFLNMGDSRICLYRNGILTQLNREHIFENELALKAVNDEMTVYDAFHNEKGAGLTSFVGMGEVSAIDMPASQIQLYKGDVILVMSDGVYNALNEYELINAIAGNAEQTAGYIDIAVRSKNYSNQDNYTAIVICCE